MRPREAGSPGGSGDSVAAAGRAEPSARRTLQQRRGKMADDFGFFSSSESGAPEAAEEDPAAAFLAQQESEIAGIENDEGFGAPAGGQAALAQPGAAGAGESAPGLEPGAEGSPGVPGQRSPGPGPRSSGEGLLSTARSRPGAVRAPRGPRGKWGGIVLEIPI